MTPRALLAPSLVALAFLSLPALGQDRPDPMVLIEPTPRLPCSGTEPACKINAALLALDQKALVLPCPPLDAARVEALGLNPGRDPVQPYEAHYVDVTFDGATFLALLFHDETFCPGKPQGATTLSAALFDKTSGEAVDPFALLPEALVTQPGALAEVYLSHLDPAAKDCAATARTELAGRPGRASFLAWPEAEGLTLMPLGLPPALRACADPVTLTADLLRTLGADPRLLADLTR